MYLIRLAADVMLIEQINIIFVQYSLRKVAMSSKIFVGFNSSFDNCVIVVGDCVSHGGGNIEQGEGVTERIVNEKRKFTSFFFFTITMRMMQPRSWRCHRPGFFVDIHRIILISWNKLTYIPTLFFLIISCNKKDLFLVWVKKTLYSFIYNFYSIPIFFYTRRTYQLNKKKKMHEAVFTFLISYVSSRI